MGYWEKRQAKMMYEYMEDAEAVAQELADIYAKASRNLNFRIREIYEKFVDKHKLSDKEAMRLLNTLHDKTSIRELLEALSKEPKNKELLAEIEAGAYRARIERLEQLQNEIDRMMQEVYNQEKKITSEYYVDLASNSYYREIYNIQDRVGYQFSFSAVDPDMVRSVLASEWSGVNYSVRIWKNTQGVADAIKEEMMIALLTGKKEIEIADEIARKFSTGAYEARRLVRTESNFVNSQMQMAAYDECGAEKYDFIAVLDLRTSEVCRNLDGQTFLVKDMQPGVNCNPMHPFCRSTTGIHVDDEVLRTTRRRARNPVTGKNELIPASTNYRQWYAKNVANTPEAQAAEKAIRHTKRDTPQYEKYRKIFGSKEAGSSLADFQMMKYNKPAEWERLKAEKQSRINAMSPAKVKKLNGMLGNKEARLWYKAHDEQISDLIDKTKPLRDRAVQAAEMRNAYRTQARDLMRDQAKRAELDIEKPNMTFEHLLEHKEKKYGLTGDAAYEDIIRSSGTTNKEYDKKAGVEK